LFAGAWRNGNQNRRLRRVCLTCPRPASYMPRVRDRGR
jgi:hypothetical protein